MSSVGFVLLLSSMSASAPDEAVLGGPRLSRGEEIVFKGDVTEQSERFGNRYLKRYAIEVRLFVLEAHRDSSDLAIMTFLKPLDDPFVVQGIGKPLELKRSSSAPSVRLELIRVTDRGRVSRIVPAVGPPPLSIGANTPTRLVAPLPLDGIPAIETGLFIQLPVGQAKFGSSWDHHDTDRPPVGWSARGRGMWNGCHCWQIEGLQQSDGWDRADTVHEGWQRTETLTLPPGDGYAATFRRVIRCRQDRTVVGQITTTYEREPTTRHVGGRYTDVRSEIESAWWFAAEMEVLMSSGKSRAEFERRARRIRQYFEDNPNISAFRPAIESTLRRCDALAAGYAPTSIVRVATTDESMKTGQFAIGLPAPDFVVADVDQPVTRYRLSQSKNKPVVLGIFKPGSFTSRGTLEIMDALHKHYAERVMIVPLAAASGIEAASVQRARMRLTVPVYDGDDVRRLYSITTYPRFIVVDADGTACWDFEGCGEEIGFLVKQEIDRVLARPKLK